MRMKAVLASACSVSSVDSRNSFRYAVSFFLGELVVLTHVCNVLLAG